MRTRILLSIVVGLCLAVNALPARGESKQERARQHFIKAKAHYAAQRYRAAIGEFKRAGRVLPSPLLDYNIAKCYEGLGLSKEAVAHYARYLRRRPQAKNRPEVEARIAALRQLLKVRRDPYEDLERAPAEGDHARAVVAPAAAAQAVSKAASLPATKPPPATSMPTAVAPAPPRSGAPATSAPSASAPAARASPPPAHGRDPWGAPRGKEQSLFRQWWFWTALGVGALIGTFIIVTTATSTTEGGAQPARGGLSIAF